MGLFSNIFSWWNAPTFGTQLFTRRFGREVGRDDQGNIYYISKTGAQTKGGERRWVNYNGIPEASRIPPEWHLWLHKTVDTTPLERPLKPRIWEKPWVPNLTGTPGAHAPSGSLAVTTQRARTTGDYEAWSPDQ